MTAVLIADDDTMTQAVVREILEDAGYTVSAVDDGAAALRYLHTTSTPHVVLLDRLMAPMSGDELLAAVVTQPRLAQQHTYVLMSAASQGVPPEVEDLLQRLHAPVVDKPFHLEHLLGVVSAQADALFAGTASSHRTTTEKSGRGSQ